MNKIEETFIKYGWVKLSKDHFMFWRKNTDFELFYANTNMKGYFENFILKCVTDIHLYKKYKPSLITTEFVFEPTQESLIPSISDKSLKRIEEYLIQSSKLIKLYECELKKRIIRKEFGD